MYKLMRFPDWLLISTVLTSFVFDRLSKNIISNWLALGESWPADTLIKINHATNSGSAFGLFPNQTMILIIASIFAIGFLVYFYTKYAVSTRILRFAVGLQLGGAAGNLLDRIRDGAVVDFIDVGPWPIFNIADSSIVVGMAILLGYFFIKRDSVDSNSKVDPVLDNSNKSNEPNHIT
ncbi:MAG: signal peptidase II [Chloroflexota bacterium]|nr:signal peptidase II [Chloroflexota bacterium]